VTRDFARALVSAGHRLALATLALEAAVGAHHAAPATAPEPAEPDPGQARLDHFGGLVRQASTQLAVALHRLGPPGPFPPLREIQAALPADADGGALFAATDSLVDALNTAADTLRRYLPPSAPAAPAAPTRAGPR
jgi:hypothetical protein